MPYRHLAQRSEHASKTHSFVVGLFQMILVAINVKNMASGNVVFSSFFTFVNTYYWIYVVRTVIHATRWEKLAYAIGSTAGVVLGIAVHYYFLRPHAFTQLATTVH